MTYHSLKQLIAQLETSYDTISKARRETLDGLADIIHSELNENNIAKITTICTHNSRRSQLLEAWIIAAALHFDIDGISAYSGGTEATAFNIRMVVALRQSGFQVIEEVPGENPKYILVPGKETLLKHVMYSKIYDDEYNPQSGFIAVMVCDSADEGCPIVAGAKHRISLHYVDPKRDDDTPMESDTYRETVELIGTEALYMMKRVKDLGIG